MGKNEMERLQPCHLKLQNMTTPMTTYMTNRRNEILPENLERFEHQVAGHIQNGNHWGMFKGNGTIMKSHNNKETLRREGDFYRELNSTCNLSLKEMRQFVPKFYGEEVIKIGDDSINCIVLEDLTKGYKEPCIMDIKIGKRTWDPNASYEKIMKEEGKFHDSKRDLNFCIPGFHFYKVISGKLCKYGKDYGKKLNKDTTIEALKLFLNADTGWNRNLLIQILVNLWQIQKWARKQNSIRLYSSSLLIIYDARRLRQTMQIDGTIKPVKSKPALLRTKSLYRPLSLAVLNDKEAAKTGFSGQLNQDGPIFPISVRLVERPPTVETKSGNKKSVPTLKRMHSFQNNYDKDLQNIKNNYVYMLDDLVDEDKTELWVTMKMIDFAHVFPAENNNVDRNYLDGIENLVKIFEGFLSESDVR